MTLNLRRDLHLLMKVHDCLNQLSLIMYVPDFELMSFN